MGEVSATPSQGGDGSASPSPSLSLEAALMGATRVARIRGVPDSSGPQLHVGSAIILGACGLDYTTVQVSGQPGHLYIHRGLGVHWAVF